MACTLQDLVTCWHEQAGPRALTEPSEFCVVQVGRFDVKPDDTYSKTDFKLDFDSFVYLPVFRENLRDVYFLKYQLRACVVHHGPTPSNGHYRAVLLSSTSAIQDAFYTDDNTNACKIKPSIWWLHGTFMLYSFSELIENQLRAPVGSDHFDHAISIADGSEIEKKKE